MNNDLDRTMMRGHLELLVLATLGRRDRHGYGIRQDLAQRTGSYFNPSFGRLYPLLADLDARGLVRRREGRGAEKQIMQVYSLTTTGRQEYGARLAKWQKFAASMDRVLANLDRRT